MTADNEIQRRTRSLSRHSVERPMGPRTPSPLPPPSHLLPSAFISSDSEAEETPPPVPQPSVRPTGIPRSKRQPFHPTGNTEMTPRPVATNSTGGSSVEPLSIKKKTTSRSESGATPAVVRRSQGSPLNRAQPRATPSFTRPEPPTSETNTPFDNIHEHVMPDQLLQTSRATKFDVRAHADV